MISSGLKNRVKNVSKDFIYNIIASLLFTGVLQVVVYPVLASKFDQEYGTILTIMGIVNAIAVSLGNTLNNVRLIMNSAYDEKQVSGDYNIILAGAVAIAIIVVAAITGIYFKQPAAQAVGISIYTALLVFRYYHCVQFRIILNFKKIMQGNVCGALGFQVGIFFLYFIPIWCIPFLLSEIFYIGYVLKNTDLYKEKYGRTALFPQTFHKYLVLIVSGLAGNLLTYMDRLIIYPLLGSDAVSTYTVASVFGKSLSIVMTPVAGVLLGYYAQSNFKMTKKLFWKINGVTIALSAAFMGVLVFAAPFVLQILYPGIYQSAIPYLFWANLAATISVSGSMTQAAVLKFAPAWVQVVKEGIYAVIYIVLGILWLNSYGLMGFCFAALLANVARLLVLYVIGTKYMGTE